MYIFLYSNDNAAIADTAFCRQLTKSKLKTKKKDLQRHIASF